MGWERYKLVSDKQAQEIKDLIDNTDDINELRIRIHIVNLSIQVESFGISWEGPTRQKNKTKRDSKDINKQFQEQEEELDQLLKEGTSAKDLNSKIYWLKEIINGQK